MIAAVETWAGAYLAGVGAGLLEMAWYAWRTRGVKLDEADASRFWRQYVAVILAWPVLVTWWVTHLWRHHWNRRNR